jgi:hypothetical protein
LGLFLRADGEHAHGGSLRGGTSNSNVSGKVAHLDTAPEAGGWEAAKNPQARCLRHVAHAPSVRVGRASQPCLSSCLHKRFGGSVERRPDQARPPFSSGQSRLSNRLVMSPASKRDSGEKYQERSRVWMQNKHRT